LVTAETIACNTQQIGPKQLFVDISVLVQQGLRTDMERATRSILLQLLDNPPAGYRVEPVYCDRGIYRYARHFTTEMLGIGQTGLRDDRINVQQQDVFLGLDLNPDDIPHSSEVFRDLASHGVGVFLVVYDILPVSHPEFFPPNGSTGFRNWLQTIAGIASGLVCISRSVADDVRNWLDTYPSNRVEPLSIGFFHLGADIENSSPTTGVPDNAEGVLETLASAPSFLMVGTVEPRKRHAQALSAFEMLWKEGCEVNLVIVGKRGWMVQDLVRRLSNHPMLGKRLFWLEGISDEYLEKIYAASTCLIAASEAEGFGLPLVEAARKGLPIIVRDIPVFREVAGEHAFYFSGLSPEDLARAVRAWLDLSSRSEAPGSKDMAWLTWKESTAQLLKLVLPS
jgi:glycosyltransferase involved in cell wall biosynthesis